MFEKVVIPEALELFLSFNTLVNLCQVNKIINKLFTISRYKRTLWNGSHLPKDHRFVYRLKLWEHFEKLDSFPNLRELELIFSSMFHFPNKFPNTLVSLRIGNNFDKKLCSLPQNLKRLEFGDYCKIYLGPGILPENIKELKFGKFCKINLHACVFPKSLEFIKFGAGFFEDLEPLCALNLKEIYLDSNWEDEDIPDNLRDKVKFVYYGEIH
jgi:hypothetical protein